MIKFVKNNNFWCAKFWHSKFWRSQFWRAKFLHSKFWRTKFWRTKFWRTKFWRAKFKRAKFWRAFICAHSTSQLNSLNLLLGDLLLPRKTDPDPAFTDCILCYCWSSVLNMFKYHFKTCVIYKKRVLVQNKLNLLLKIILHNTWALQLYTINVKIKIETCIQMIMKKVQA